MNKRRHPRRRISVTVTLDPGAITSGTADISVHGVFLKTARVLPPGTTVRLALRVPSGQAWAEGIVRWAKRVPPELLPFTKGGMGIQFTMCSPELADYLKEIFGSGVTVEPL